ncbi:hypothetical protein F511_37474 [Dorcoceras hygrometricum]|uniref:Uncharacterized protein n=1 Tax=Dorcoceras hygrometricum TaxID=472368 RepID=A0A2Z7DFH4_9LAMI|nr:hypothetical protein F511_37474 [Dorcoceras hygrometricum]
MQERRTTTEHGVHEAQEPAQQLPTDRTMGSGHDALAIQEEEESQAGAGAMKKSAGALRVDDFSSDVIFQQEATVGLNQQRASTSSCSRKLQWIQSQRKDFQTQCLSNQSQDTSWKHMFNTSWTTRRKQQQHPVVSLYESAVATPPVASFAYSVDLVPRRKKRRSSEVLYSVAGNSGAKNRRNSKAQQLKDKSAAKQLTIYESWMSTAELNSNGENDKKPAKEKDASTVPLSVLYKTHFKREGVVSNGKKFYRGFIYKGSAIDEVPVQARRRKTHVYVVSHTVEAVVHLWSLGVLTAAGCEIGSVHAVVRSNLLVEPSEVEEGEM